MTLSFLHSLHFSHTLTASPTSLLSGVLTGDTQPSLTEYTHTCTLHMLAHVLLCHETQASLLGKRLTCVKVPDPHPYPIPALGVSTKKAHHQVRRKVIIASVSNPIPSVTAVGVLLNHVTAALNWVGVGETSRLFQLCHSAVPTISSWQSREYWAALSYGQCLVDCTNQRQDKYQQHC